MMMKNKHDLEYDLEHDFLLSDLNKTIEQIRKITTENLILKAKISKVENIIKYSLDDIINLVKAENISTFECNFCKTKHFVIGKKIPGKLYKIHCLNCNTDNICNREAFLVIKF
jgi:hypothetical protein